MAALAAQAHEIAEVLRAVKPPPAQRAGSKRSQGAAPQWHSVGPAAANSPIVPSQATSRSRGSLLKAASSLAAVNFKSERRPTHPLLQCFPFELCHDEPVEGPPVDREEVH